MNPATPVRPAAPWAARVAPLVRAFHAYANWLVSITWKRFLLLSLLLMIGSGVLQNLPPFSWTVSETIETKAPRVVVVPTPPKPPKAPSAPAGADGKGPSQPLIKIERPQAKEGSGSGDLEISIGGHGIRITPRTSPKAASAAEAAASAAEAAERVIERATPDGGVRIVLPPGATADAVREAVEVAKREIEASIEQAREDAEEAKRDAEQAKRDAEQAIADLSEDAGSTRTVVRHTKFGEPLPELAFFWIVVSMIIKITYKGQLKAEAEAAQATEVAESEQLKRQVVEARMAAMQAQVEPHFLFNTLASIDHLIETDPARASVMQKNLIALLRASMPTMREASNGGPRDLGRELAVVRPYLEILKVRMEERLSTRHRRARRPAVGRVPADDDPEPGRERDQARPRAQARRRRADDQGRDRARQAGGHGGRHRPGLRQGGHRRHRRRPGQHPRAAALLYGGNASLSVTENRPSGTVVTITVPYTTAPTAHDGTPSPSATMQA